MESSKCKGVLFDMDGVLVDSEEYIARAACMMFAEKAVQVKPEDFRPFIGTGEDRFLGGVAEKYHVMLNMPADKVRTYDIYLEIIKGKLKPLAGVVEFISKCKSAGMKMAIASSADKQKVTGNIKEIGLDDGQFGAIVCGEDIAHKKPAPDIFILAAKKIGLLPNQCLVIEDAVSGVQAARAAGAKCLGITSSFTRQQLNADFHAKDLTEVGMHVLNW